MIQLNRCDFVLEVSTVSCQVWNGSWQVITEGSRRHLRYLSDAEASGSVSMRTPPPRVRCAPQPCPRSGSLYSLHEYHFLPPPHIVLKLCFFFVTEELWHTPAGLLRWMSRDHGCRDGFHSCLGMPPLCCIFPLDPMGLVFGKHYTTGRFHWGTYMYIPSGSSQLCFKEPLFPCSPETSQM